MSDTTIHTAPWVILGEPDPVRRGAVGVADGTIRAVGRLAEVRREVGLEAPVIEWEGTLSPGLVNAHTHLQYGSMAELGQTSYDGFETWSDAFETLYAEPHDWRKAAEAGLEAAIRTGTTAFADVVTHVDALDVLHAGRAHGVAYWEVMAWLDADWGERGRAETLAVVENAQGADFGISPHSPYSLDTEVLQDLGRIAAQRGQRSHLHLAESAYEAEYVRHGSGALAEQWRDWGFGGFALLQRGGTPLTPVAYAESLGALGPHSHIAHGVYVGAEDRATLRRNRTAVALCPRSNAVIGLDPAPVADYLREGNVISVGTDSLSSSPSLDLMGDVAALYAIARRQGYAAADLHRRLFDAATSGGATALGRAGGLGSLAAGAVANLTVFDADFGTGRDTLAAIVESGEGQVTATVVTGEVRWQRHTQAAQTS